MSSPATASAQPTPPGSEPKRGPRRVPPRLGEILVKAKVIDERTLEQVLAEQKKKGGGRLGYMLTMSGACSEEQIRKALREQMNVEVVDLHGHEPQENLTDVLPLEVIRRHEVIPLERNDRQLWVAMLDPYNLAAIDEIKFISGISHVRVSACTEGDFKRHLQYHLETRGLIDEILEEEDFYKKAIEQLRSGDPDLPDVTAEEEDDEISFDLKLATDQSPVITLCNFVLVEAIRKRASDIHLEPHEEQFRVRLRVDGRLRNLLTPPKRLEVPMIARFKVVSELDISKRRIPQDGQLSVIFNGQKVNFRVSTLPTSYGEKCVLRILKRDPALTSLDRLGFEADELETFQKSLGTSQGLVLVTGPTGSGKTTTVHAGLDHINSPEINIVTLEDPVEVTLPGINHVPIREKGGVTFASGLRSILRQDPDVVFVGEMRDTEVASIALRASLTGHFVISTLHTNSAVESLVRLDDMEAPSYLVAGALLLIVAQRLVRRICPECAEPAPADPAEVEILGIDKDRLKDARLMHGAGCKQCGETGYYGRTAVYEILRVTPELRQLIRKRADADDVFEAARAAGMKTLIEAGVARALRGETTLSEVRRVLYRVE